MVDNNNTSILHIQADSGPDGDILIIDAPVDTYTTDLLTGYTTIYNDSTLTPGQEIAQIHWHTAA